MCFSENEVCREEVRAAGTQTPHDGERLVVAGVGRVGDREEG